ncbi:MAG TPA: pyridoxal phosphate-dependent aminotransferase [Bacillus sp. (in: firmicutes)]|uniref:pyridoxal phosphate-dependent aminotransferase n=1 Tax=Bacillus litorisediminis TaxID=2922713 RepID=UPI001FAEFB5B|nr:pyridoxal phosphate-dependent aminotransferase [Bacillus litorisediminis]HWO75951.1 pyridoxal phosphate-dependent aminotransferase [Bacillus sp. (in: firmicutes)]
MINVSDLSLINLSLGEIKGGPSEELRKFSSSKVLEEWQGYTSPYGIYELRRAILDHFQPLFQNKLQLSQVLVTAGASMALTSAYHLISNKRLLIPNIGFPLYRKTAAQLGLQFTEYHIGPDKNWARTIQQIEEGFKSGIRALIWNNPNNPLGFIAPGYVVEEMCELCKRYKALCITDEVYREFNGAVAVTSPSEMIPNQTIFIYSFSKSYGLAGIRVGCVIAHPQIIEGLREVHWNSGMSVSWIGQEIAKYAIESLPDYPHELSQKVKNRLKNAVIFFREKDIPFYFPDGGIYICIDTKELGIDSAHFTTIVREKANLQLMPGMAFGNESASIVRLNAGVEDEVFYEALQRVEYVYRDQKGLKETYK